MKKGFWFYSHLILGLVFAIPIVIVGVTGAALSYKDEILKLINPETYKVEQVLGKKLTPKELIEKFSTNNPSLKVESITVYQDDISTARVQVASTSKENRRGVTYYVDPYSAEILQNPKGVKFFSVMMSLHRWFNFDGTSLFGKNFVAICTIVLIFLSISGVYLYWTPIKRNIVNALKINFRKRGYAFNYQLHNAVGLWFCVLYLLMSLTGLYWSYGWYRNALYKISGVDAPVRQVATTTSNKNIEKSTENIDLSYDIFLKETNGDFSYASIKVPFENQNIHTWTFGKNGEHSRARNQIDIDINQKTAVKKSLYSEKPLNEKLMSSMLPLHSGEYFGKIGLALFFISSLLMPLFAITGLLMYLKRSSKKRKSRKKENENLHQIHINMEDAVKV